MVMCDVDEAMEEDVKGAAAGLRPADEPEVADGGTSNKGDGAGEDTVCRRAGRR